MSHLEKENNILQEQIFNEKYQIEKLTSDMIDQLI